MKQLKPIPRWLLWVLSLPTQIDGWELVLRIFALSSDTATAIAVPLAIFTTWAMIKEFDPHYSS